MMLVYLLYYRAGGWMSLSIPPHPNPFHIYFSVVPHEQDELANIILHQTEKLTDEKVNT